MITHYFGNVFNTTTHAVLAGLTAVLFILLLTPWVRHLSVKMGWISRSKEERWGKRVIARLGGVALFLSFVATTLIWVPMQPSFVGLLCGLGLVFALGLVDDLRRIPPYTKLLAQLVIGCIVVMSGVRIELIEWAWLSIPISVLWFVFCMNAFNLLDNMDGLAAGTGALAALFGAWFAASIGQAPIMWMGVILCGVCVGFLRFNFPPAKIYMGDSGSHFIGLCLAGLAILGSWQHSTQLLSVLAIPMLVLAVPIFDTCFVTLQRLLHHKNPFMGGTDHVSHRLAILGLSSRQTILALYGVSTCLGLLSMVSTTFTPVQAGVVWMAVLIVLMLFGLYLAKVKVYQLQPARSEQGTVVWTGKSQATFIETMLMHKRRLLEILVDFGLIVMAYVLSYLLRFEGVLSSDIQELITKSLPVVLLIKIGSFSIFRLYRGVWKYLGLTDLVAVFKAVTLSSVLSVMALVLIWRFEGYSRAVFIIDGMLTFLLVGGARVVERLLDDWISGVSSRGTSVLIFGAGDTGARVLRSIREEGKAHRVVGFLDDDIRKLNNRIYGVPILGSRNRLSEVLIQHKVQEVLIAINDPSGELLQWVRHGCEPLGVKWRVVRAGVTEAL
jgi:UDP-GlcNAc:undecaprenyl-phosphate/decaprenyl-phosphate GlcNAc-1-phosphate transferase